MAQRFHGWFSYRAVWRFNFLVVGPGDGCGHGHPAPNGRQRLGLTDRAAVVYPAFHALSRSDEERCPSRTWPVRWMGRLLDSDCGDKLASVESPIGELSSHRSVGVITGSAPSHQCHSERTLCKLPKHLRSRLLLSA